MMLKSLPWMGVGQRWDGPQDTPRFERYAGLLDFVEPALPGDLSALPDLPTIAHSSELPLASRQCLNPQMLHCLSSQVRSLEPPWAGEHICLNSSIETGELGYNFAPLLDAETVSIAIQNAKSVQALYRCPLALEAGPRYFRWAGRWDDHALIAEVAEATGSGIVLDLSHHLCTTRNLSLPATAGLSPRVLERTVEVHITGMGKHRGEKLYHDSHDQPVSAELWNLLDWVLSRVPDLRALTLEHSAKVDDGAYARDLELLCFRARAYRQGRD